MSDPIRFPIHFSRWFIPLASLLGMGPRRCYLELTGDDLTVRMGWAFRGRLPRHLIVRARRSRLPLWAGVGVHWLPRGWVVNGSQRDVVELWFGRPVRVRVGGFDVRLRRLFVSVDDPDALLHAVSDATRIAPAPADAVVR